MPAETDGVSGPAAAAGAQPGRDTLIGVLSDTHDHLYPSVKELLAGVDHIIHAGDVCCPGLLSELRGIAPLTVVRGNCDAGAWAESLPGRADLEVAGLQIAVAHIGGRLREEAARRGPGPQGVDIVVFGHSHQSLIESKNGVLFLNPGSAGPCRYGRPRTMAFLRINPVREASASIVVLEG
jgi:putative phosphoesterase